MSPVDLGLLVSAGVYVGGLLWFLVGASKGERRQDRSSGTEPASVAVVVAARDEAAHVEACLNALRHQEYDGCLEVVFVDDNSSDDTLERARRCARRPGEHDGRIRVLDRASCDDGGGKKAALAFGIRESDSELILTTDADCSIPRSWVATMAAAFEPQTGAVVGFSQIGEPGASAGRLAAWEGLDFLQLMTAAAGSSAHGHPMAASGQNLGFRRQAFEQVGGYGSVRHRVSGDDVLLLQLIRRGRRWSVAFCGAEGARVVHPPSPSLGSFLSRRARWASNAPCQLRLDPVFFLYMVATYGLSLGLTTAPVLWSAGLVSSGVVASVWATKAAAELALAVAGARRFGRLDLLRVFPLWVVLQPLYTAVVGGVGPLGFFRWKGRSFALGRQPRVDDTVATPP